MGTVALYIFGSVFAISLVSLIGVFTISLREETLKKAMAFFIPLAVGALLGDAFLHLIPESFTGGKTELSSLLVLVGIFLFFALEKYLRWHHHHSSEEIAREGEDMHKTAHLGSLILVSDAFHNFIDGIIVAAGYMAGMEAGIATTIAVILHEIPQEIGDFSVLIYAGYKKRTALFYNFISALSAILGAALVLIFGDFSERLEESMIPLAAGMFIYIASSDLVPELHKNTASKEFLLEIIGILVGILAMYLLLFLE